MSLKLVKKLGLKKYREETGLFVVEGKKSILELIHSPLIIETLYVTESVYEEIEGACTRRGIHPEIVVTTEAKLGEVGTFESNAVGIAIARQKEAPTTEQVLEQAHQHFVLVLDDIRDPGNLGTIIRTADWFGISTIIASPSTVDIYNPKVVSSSMGSLTRIDVLYTDLPSLLEEATERRIHSYGAFLDGTPTSMLTPERAGLIIVGSESHGISDSVATHIKTRITIPKYGHAESLNVGVATGIILSTLVERRL